MKLLHILFTIILTFKGIIMSQAADPQSISHPTLSISTTKGAFEIELYPEYAPKHVERILTLAHQGFYNGILFHRVVPNFVAQAGDPLSKKGLQVPNLGANGSDLPDLKLEVTPKLTHLRGMVGMARSPEPDSANSQFYIALKDIHQLDMQYTVFGRVTGEGMKIVDQLKVGDKIIEFKENKK